MPPADSSSRARAEGSSALPASGAGNEERRATAEESSARFCAQRAPNTRFCAKHAPRHSIHYSQLCCHPECDKVASFEVGDPLARGRYAAQRDRVRRQRNARSFSTGSDRLVFCAAHAPPGVLDFRHAKCAAADCQSQGIWVEQDSPGSRRRRCPGEEGGKRAGAGCVGYCHRHRRADMVLRASRRRCNTTFPHAATARDRAQPDLYSASPPPTPIASMQQQQQQQQQQRSATGAGLALQARYAETGDYCYRYLGKDWRGRELTLGALQQGSRAEDAQAPAMQHRKCMHPLGCERFASFGFMGDKPRFCAAHKAANHTYLRRRCEVAGCDARPAYGLGRGLTHCRAHRCLP
jgi:hypothetical protein